MGPRRARKKNQRLAHLNRPAPRRGHAFLFSNKKGLEGRNRFLFCRDPEELYRNLRRTGAPKAHSKNEGFEIRRSLKLRKIWIDNVKGVAP